MAEQRTTKKVKVVGTETYINAATGEIEEMQVTNVEDRDFNFTKVWMKQFIATLDIVGNKKMKVALWVIDNINKDNMLTYTYRQISQKSGHSYQTVQFTMTALLEADFLRKINSGVYVINPDVLYKGTRQGRMNVLTKYKEAQTVDKVLTKEERIKNLQETQNALMMQVENIGKQIEKLSQDATQDTTVVQAS